jgi:hypothetical protein
MVESAETFRKEKLRREAEEVAASIATQKQQQQQKYGVDE